MEWWGEKENMHITTIQAIPKHVYTKKEQKPSLPHKNNHHNQQNCVLMINIIYNFYGISDNKRSYKLIKKHNSE